MRTGATLRPHQRGAQKLLAQYGDRLLCVRYRYDEQHKTRLKTVELEALRKLILTEGMVKGRRKSEKT